MSQPYSNVALAIQAVVTRGAHSATKYISPKRVVKITQRLRAGRVLPKANENLDFVVTIGRPNYADRLFIKDAIKAGEPFPIKKILLKYPAAVRVPKAKNPNRLTKAEKEVRALAAKVLGQTRQRAA